MFADPALAVDLIETLWNVKFSVSCIDVRVLDGFNRDIVECKVH